MILVDANLLAYAYVGSFQQHERPTAGTRLSICLHEIAGPIANDRAAESTEISDDQLALGFRRRRFFGQGIDHFDDKFILVDVDGAGLRAAFEAECARFRRAGVIVALRAPSLFNHLLGAGDACARLAGVDGDLYRGIFGEIDSRFSRLRRHMERVRRRGDEHGRAAINDRSESLGGGLRAAANRQRAELARALPTRPKADEGPERKSKIDVIAGADTGRFKDNFPALRPPIPRLLGVEPVHRFARGAGSLVHPNVAFRGESKIAAERRMKRLVFDQFAFAGEGQASQLFERIEMFKIHTGKFIAVKFVRRQDSVHQLV